MLMYKLSLEKEKHSERERSVHWQRKQPMVMC